MKRLRCYLPLFAVVFLCGCPLPPDTAPTRAGKWYMREPVTGSGYWMYLPKDYSHEKPMKVIISCHGTPPFDVAKHHIDTWGMYGDKYGCIVICPELVGTDGIFGAGAIYDMKENEERILSILSSLSYQYNLDRANIMITGFSGGGFPVYWVGLRHPDIFSAVIAQNCNFNQGNTDGWFPRAATKIAVMIYYGQNDPLPIKVQSKNGIDYLRSKGFTVKTRVIRHERTGHDRHPEIAMEFFKQNWRTPDGTNRQGPAVRIATNDNTDFPEPDGNAGNGSEPTVLTDGGGSGTDHSMPYVGKGPPPPLP